MISPLSGGPLEVVQGTASTDELLAKLQSAQEVSGTEVVDSGMILFLFAAKLDRALYALYRSTVECLH